MAKVSLMVVGCVGSAPVAQPAALPVLPALGSEPDGSCLEQLGG